MRGRRGKKEEEELKRRIRTLLEEGKTYKEIREETGAGRSTIAKVKKQMEKEEVGQRSPLEANPEENQDEVVDEEIDEEEATRQLEAIDKAAGNTALNEIIAKVKAKAKLEVDEIYTLGLVLRDVLQSEAGEEYYKAAEKSGLSLEDWIRQTLERVLWHRYYFMYSLWEHPDLYRVVNWSLDAFKLWHQEWRYELLRREYEKRG
jgi:transposase